MKTNNTAGNQPPRPGGGPKFRRGFWCYAACGLAAVLLIWALAVLAPSWQKKSQSLIAVDQNSSAPAEEEALAYLLASLDDEGQASGSRRPQLSSPISPPAQDKPGPALEPNHGLASRDSAEARLPLQADYSDEDDFPPADFSNGWIQLEVGQSDSVSPPVYPPGDKRQASSMYTPPLPLPPQGLENPGKPPTAGPKQAIDQTADQTGFLPSGNSSAILKGDKQLDEPREAAKPLIGLFAPTPEMSKAAAENQFPAKGETLKNARIPDREQAGPKPSAGLGRKAKAQASPARSAAKPSTASAKSQAAGGKDSVELIIINQTGQAQVAQQYGSVLNQLNYRVSSAVDVKPGGGPAGQTEVAYRPGYKCQAQAVARVLPGRKKLVEAEPGQVLASEIMIYIR